MTRRWTTESQEAGTPLYLWIRDGVHVRAKPADPYGEAASPEGYTAIGPRMRASLIKASRGLHHPKPNGLYDPITLFLVAEMLLRIQPGPPFRSAGLVSHLAKERSQLLWDSTTVGKILNDMASRLEAAYGQPIIQTRRSGYGRIYAISDNPIAHVALARLAIDLLRLAENLVDAYKTAGIEAIRIGHSPLDDCPSLVAAPAPTA